MIEDQFIHFLTGFVMGYSLRVFVELAEAVKDSLKARIKKPENGYTRK